MNFLKSLVKQLDQFLEKVVFGSAELSVIGSPELNLDFDGFLWGVPKHRKTIEQRWKKKMAEHPRYKAYLRNDILTCIDCGHFHLKGCICENCYQKIKEETHKVLRHINPINQYKPIETDVYIKYDNDQPPEHLECDKEHAIVDGKRVRIVEINKPRPLWFDKNLLKLSNDQ